MGYVGGKLGAKNFTEGKAKIAKRLRDSGINTAIVEPTLVYGEGRDDSMTKYVPLLKFFGIFSSKLKPVLVTDVADELVEKITKY